MESSAASAPIISSRLDSDLIRRTLRVMILSRTLETKLSSLYKAGKIVGGVYLGTWQEAFSASLGCCLDQEKDIFAPLIRDQAGRTGFGEPLIDATRTYLGSDKFNSTNLNSIELFKGLESESRFEGWGTCRFNSV